MRNGIGPRWKETKAGGLLRSSEVSKALGGPKRPEASGSKMTMRRPIIAPARNGMLHLAPSGQENHFAERQVVEESESAIGTEASQHALYEAEVVPLVHSGSRGYGGFILKQYTKDGRESMREDDSMAKSYLQVHDRACNWASRNRDLHSASLPGTYFSEPIPPI